MPDATGVDLTTDIATHAAKEAMKDPRVQQAVQDEAKKQGEAALLSAQATWCESFGQYMGKLRETPKILPFGESFTCSQPDDAAWLAFFGKWNVLYCQSHLVVFPVFLVLHLCWILYSVFAGAGFAWLFVTQLVQRVVGFAVVVLVSHGTHYLYVEKGGCCGGAGAAIWMIIYFILGLGPVIAVVTAFRIDGVGFFYVFYQGIYLITTPGLFFMCLCLWKVGGGAAVKAGLNRTVEAGKGAISSMRKSDARDIEAAPGAAPAAQANAPLAH